VKPDNVMLERDPGPSGGGRQTLRGRLGDLGLAQVINPGLTVTGIGPVGTIEYLAPEQVHGHKASRASDIWSFGVTLHRALTGRGIYETFPLGSLLEALRHVTSSRPNLSPDLGDGVALVVGRCLAQDPAARYGTAADLASALQELVS
jgi:eukaryotic-like serine/threonine-protein kinase